MSSVWLIDFVKFMEQTCLGKNHCSIVVARETFGDKKCPEIVKTMAVQVKCEKTQGKKDDEKKKEDKEKEEEDDEDEEEDEEEETEKEKENKDV